MAPKILLADDSMTAQNMGKKILAEGGYEVVAVSNGAAALKKIAESRPELVILDVYMPGYSGLEVCERLRGTLNTTNLPVLLTVGKLEPFKPEEGTRVKADGVLVKPFEATDLLAAVKKLLEKGTAQPEPVPYEDTVRLEPPVAPGFSDASSPAWKDETPEYEKTQKIEVPQEMSAAPAMSELLDATPQTPAVKPAATMAAAAGAEVPAFNVEPGLPELTAAPVPVFDLDLLDEPAPQPAPTEQALEPEAPSADSILDALMPELELNAPAPAPEAVGPVPEVEFTAAPQAQDVVTETLPDLEPTVLQDAIPVEVASDAALVTSPEELAQFTTKFGVDNPEQTPVGIAADLPAEQAAILSEPPKPIAEPPAVAETVEPVIEATPEVAPQPEPIMEPEPVPEVAIKAEPVIESAPPVEEVSAPDPGGLAEPAVVEPEAATPEAAPVIELAPAVEKAPAEETIQEQAFSLEEELQRAFADTPAAPLAPDDVPVDEFVPFSRANEAAAEEDAIAQLVERLMERLKPELVAAIVKELKG